MKSYLLALAVAVALSGTTGCQSNRPFQGGSGNDCGCSQCGAGGQTGGPPAIGPRGGGPPTGAVTYPYYTTRGPRDFLQNDPPSIGR